MAEAKPTKKEQEAAASAALQGEDPMVTLDEIYGDIDNEDPFGQALNKPPSTSLTTNISKSAKVYVKDDQMIFSQGAEALPVYPETPGKLDWTLEPYPNPDMTRSTKETDSMSVYNSKDEQHIKEHNQDEFASFTPTVSEAIDRSTVYLAEMIHSTELHLDAIRLDIEQVAQTFASENVDNDRAQVMLNGIFDDSPSQLVSTLFRDQLGHKKYFSSDFIEGLMAGKRLAVSAVRQVELLRTAADQDYINQKFPIIEQQLARIAESQRELAEMIVAQKEKTADQDRGDRLGTHIQRQITVPEVDEYSARGIALAMNAEQCEDFVGLHALLSASLDDFNIDVSMLNDAQADILYEKFDLNIIILAPYMTGERSRAFILNEINKSDWASVMKQLNLVVSHKDRKIFQNVIRALQRLLAMSR